MIEPALRWHEKQYVGAIGYGKQVFRIAVLGKGIDRPACMADQVVELFQRLSRKMLDCFARACRIACRFHSAFIYNDVCGWRNSRSFGQRESPRCNDIHLVANDAESDCLNGGEMSLS